MDSLVAVFITWIAANTGLQAPPPPKVVLIPQHELVKMYFGSEERKVMQIRGLYDRTTMTIYLPATWDDANLRDKSDLLHELLHHAQNTNNVIVPCEAARERMAMTFQLRWLEEQGVKNPMKLLDTNELTISLISRCGSD